MPAPILFAYCHCFLTYVIGMCLRISTAGKEQLLFLVIIIYMPVSHLLQRLALYSLNYKHFFVIYFYTKCIKLVKCKWQNLKDMKRY